MLSDRFFKAPRRSLASPTLIQPDAQIALPNTSDGVRRWFSAFQHPILVKNMAIKIAAVEAIIIFALVGTAYRMAGNSGPKPYFVEHDKTSGAVYLSSKYATEFSPSAANNRYFLVKWASRVFTISADTHDTLTNQIPAASRWTIGAATTELSTLVTETDPIAVRVVKEPGLTRAFEENATSFSPDGGTAYMIFTTTESVAGHPKTPKQQLLTINFTTAPETLQQGDEKDNPIGLRPTHFVVTPYSGINPGAAQCT
jgi:type IV secretion system protein TrbF